MKIRRSFSARVLLLVSIVFAAALLTALGVRLALRGDEAAAPAPAPSALPRLPPPDAVVLAQRDGHLAAAIAVRPSGAAQATFIDTDARAVDVGPVAIDGRPSAGCGVGCYVGRATPRGVVTVRHGGATLRFDLGRPEPAGQLLSRISRAYLHLRGTVYLQQISTGLGGRVQALWKEAPNAFSYRLGNGDEAIVIGRDRWDRSRGKPWQESTTLPHGGLTPPWGTTGRLTNAHILRRDPKTVLLTFLGASPTYPVWFSLAVERDSTRVLSVQMTAAGHFMRTRYLSWNRAVDLGPPRS